MKNSSFLLVMSVMPIALMGALSSGLFSRKGFDAEKFTTSGILLVGLLAAVIWLRHLERKRDASTRRPKI